MVKYLAQDILDALSSHLENLQRTLNIHEPQVGQQSLQQGLMRTHRATQAINDAMVLLAQLLGSRNLLARQMNVLLAVLEQLPLGVIVLDETSQVVLSNAASEKNFGFHVVNVPVENWPTQFGLHKSDQEEAALRPEYLPFFRTLATAQLAESEIFLRSKERPDGMWIKMSAYPLQGPHSTSGAICILTDVTAQHNESNSQSGKAVARRADLILQRSTEAFGAINSNARISDWNDAAATLLGFPAQEIIGRDVRDVLVPPAYRTLFEATLHQLFEKGRASLPIGRAEIPVLHNDGKERIVKVSAFYVKSETDESIAGFFEDVTQRKILDQFRDARYAVTRLITESSTLEELLPRLVQTVTSAIGWEIGLVWAIDPSSRALRLQQAWHPDAKFDAFVRRSRELSLARNSEGSLTRVWSSGECGWTTDIVALERDPQAKIAESAELHCCVAFPIISNWELQAIAQFFVSEPMERNEDLLSLMKDIGTQVSQFADATRAVSARQRLSAIVDSSTDALVSVSLAGVIVGWNAGAQAIYGYEPISIIGKDVAVLFAPEYEGAARQIVNDVRTQRSLMKGEFKHLTQRNQVVEVELSAFPVLDGSGAPVSIGFASRDISERKQREEKIVELNNEIEEHARKLALANEQLESVRRSKKDGLSVSAPADKLKSDLIPKMSREMKTPMNAIMGLSEVLSKSTSLSEEEREYLKMIRESGSTLLGVFNEINESAKIADGIFNVVLSDFALTSVIENAAETLTALSIKKRVPLTTFITPHLPKLVRGDANKLGKIVSQLMETEFQYTTRGGVLVRTELENTAGEQVFVRIELGDLVGGLNALSRSSNLLLGDMTTLPFDTTESGAQLTKQLVDALGGTVGRRVSSADGSSTLWTVLPFETLPAPKTEPDAAMHGRKALVVEGPNGAAKIMRLCCDEWGISCDVVLTADDALSALQSQSSHGSSYDVVVLESAMYGMSGQSLVSAIKGLAGIVQPDIVFYGPFLDEQEASVLKTMQVGAVLSGPMRQSQLHSAIRNLMSKRPLAAPVANVPAVILIVDDNFINRKVTGLQVASLGLESHVVTSGQEAIQAAESSQFAMILMDCEMPDMSGFVAAQHIRKLEQAKGRRTPIVAITSNASEADRLLSIESGIDEYLEQPVETDTFSRVFKKWLPAHLHGAVLGTAPASGSPAALSQTPPVAKLPTRSAPPVTEGGADVAPEIASANTSISPMLAKPGFSDLSDNTASQSVAELSSDTQSLEIGLPRDDEFASDHEFETSPEAVSEPELDLTAQNHMAQSSYIEEGVAATIDQQAQFMMPSQSVESPVPPAVVHDQRAEVAQPSAEAEPITANDEVEQQSPPQSEQHSNFGGSSEGADHLSLSALVQEPATAHTDVFAAASAQDAEFADEPVVSQPVMSVPVALEQSEPVAAAPEHVAAAPEPVAAAPEPVAAAPEHVAAAPEPVAAAPEPVAAAPEHVAAAPEPVAAAPEPVAAAPEHVAAAPEPVAAVPEPVAAVPEPVVAAPEPVAVAPEPIALAPEPVAVEPEPVAVEPEPVAVEPEPVAVEPEPVAVEPEPVAVAPEPAAVAPEPVAVAPEPVSAVPEPIAPAPEPVVHQTPVHPSPADIFKSSFSMGADDDLEFELSEIEESAPVNSQPATAEHVPAVEMAPAAQQSAEVQHVVEPARAPEPMQAVEPAQVLEPAQAAEPMHVVPAMQAPEPIQPTATVPAAEPTHVVEPLEAVGAAPPVVALHVSGVPQRQVPTMSAADISAAEQDDQFTMPDLEPTPQSANYEQQVMPSMQPDVVTPVETPNTFSSERQHALPVIDQVQSVPDANVNTSPQSVFNFITGGQSSVDPVNAAPLPPPSKPSVAELDDFWSQPIETVRTFDHGQTATPAVEPVQSAETATSNNVIAQEQFDHAPMHQTAAEFVAPVAEVIEEVPSASAQLASLISGSVSEVASSPEAAPPPSAAGGNFTNLRRFDESGQFSSMMMPQTAHDAKNAAPPVAPVAPPEVETAPAPVEAGMPKPSVFIGFDDAAVPVAPVAPPEVETAPAPVEAGMPKPSVFIGFDDAAVPVAPVAPPEVETAPAPVEPVTPKARVFIGYDDVAVPVSRWEPMPIPEEAPAAVPAPLPIVQEEAPLMTTHAVPAEVAAPASTPQTFAAPEPVLAHVEPPVAAPPEVVPTAPASAAVPPSQNVSSAPLALPSGDELMSMGLDELQAMAEMLLRGVKGVAAPAAQPEPEVAPVVNAAPPEPPVAPYVPPVVMPVEPVVETPVAPAPVTKPDGLKSLAEKLAEAKLSLFDDLDIGWTGNTGTHAQIQSEPSQRLSPEPQRFQPEVPAAAPTPAVAPSVETVSSNAASPEIEYTAPDAAAEPIADFAESVEPAMSAQHVAAYTEPEIPEAPPVAEIPEVPYVEPRPVSAAEELATLFSNTPVVPSTPSVPVNTETSASLSFLLDELKGASVPSNGASGELYANASAEPSLPTAEQPPVEDDSANKHHLHAGADAAANVKASSLFGDDDDDLEAEMMVFERPAQEVPTSEISSSAASNPSAELAALFDTVMDEGRNPDRTTGVAIPEPSANAISDPQRAAFLSELRALEELMPPESELPAPTSSNASHASFTQELSDAAAREAEIQRSRFEAELLALDDDEPSEAAEPAAAPVVPKMPTFADMLKETGVTNGGHDELEEQSAPSNGQGAHVAEPAVVPAQEAFNQYMRRSQVTEAQPGEVDVAGGFAPAPSPPTAAPGPASPADPAPRKVGRAWPSLPAAQKTAPFEPAVVAETPAAQPVSAAHVPVATPFAQEAVPGTAQSEPDEEESPIIDLVRLEKICGVAGMRDIIAEFIVSSQEMVDRLEASIANKTDDARRAASHELTGSCSALGAKQLQEMAMAMLMVPGDDWELSQALLVHLKDAHDSLKAFLFPLVS